MKSVTYAKAALKGLRKCEKGLAQRVMDRLDAYAAGQIDGLDMKRLSGRSEYRLRVGGVRALFTDDGDEVTVHDVGPRGDIYKR